MKTILKLLGGYSQIIGGNVFPWVSAPLLLTHSSYSRGLQEGGSGGTSYPGPGLGGPGLKGPGRVQVSALSFGFAP